MAQDGEPPERAATGAPPEAIPTGIGLPTPRRAFGRALADFRIEGQTTPHGLMPAEERLLEACRMGKACDLRNWAKLRAGIRELTKAKTDPAVFDLAVAVVRAGDDRPTELEESIAAQPAILHAFYREEIARFLPPDDGERRALVTVLEKEPERLREPFDACHAMYAREAGAWRAVDADDETITVRGPFLRFLLLGGDDTAPVHESGVRLLGAVIEGTVDCTGAVLPYRALFQQCIFTAPLTLRESKTRSVLLTGCLVSTLDAQGAEVGGGVFLSNGFRAQGAVRLPGAKITGQLTCRGGTFLNPGGVALIADGAEVGGDVFLSDGFRAQGAVRLLGAKIAGQLTCNGGTFLNPGGDALFADNAEVGGSVFLSDGFRAQGEVRLLGAKITGDLILTGGIFRNATPRPAPDRYHPTPRADNALLLGKTTIEGRLWLSAAAPPYDKPITIEGSIGLQSAYAATLVYDPAMLPPGQITADADPTADPAKPAPRLLDCTVSLDGFTYDHLDIDSLDPAGPPDAVTALKTLFSRQPSAHLGLDFRPQPYEHAIALFNTMGRDDEAQKITRLKAQGRRLRTRLKLTADVKRALKTRPGRWPLSLLGPLAWVFWPVKFLLLGLGWVLQRAAGLLQWLAFDWFLGAGYDRTKPLVAFIVFALLGAWFYGIAADHGVFMPADKGFVDNAENRRLCAGVAKGEEPPLATHINWFHCAARPDGYTVLHPLIYSLDLMVPFGSLGPRRDWRIDETRSFTLDVPGFSRLTVPAQAVSWLSVAQTYAAIGLYTVLLAFLTGAIKKE